MNRKKILAFVCFAVLMFALGSSDSLRGIFAPVFQEKFVLTDAQLSMMVTISYIGNLLFLSIGGKLLDTFGRKRVMISVTALWFLAMVLNVVTENYVCIMISMFFALGASTLLNTSVNIMTPVLFAGSAGLMVNVFFFIQGIGTSGSQFLLGRYVFSYEGFRATCLVLAVIGVATILLLFLIPMNGGAGVQKPEEFRTDAAEQKKSVFVLFCLMFGCYFIAEHGIMNWMLTYCIQAFGFTSEKASLYLSVFWGGMTVGRLVFAGFVQKMGTKKSLRIFGAAGTVLFCVGVIAGQTGVILLSLSGLALSVLYPTMVLLIQQMYPAAVAATRTGTIISIGTIADILFNSVFGVIAGAVGYRMGFMILPAAMICFYISLCRIFAGTRKIGAENL
ncbi:MAG TPA: MFS transporter [Candidatus Blautia stercoravium]|nr:MFS transporter [Candidatus Blautia stercoravium]